MTKFKKKIVLCSSNMFQTPNLYQIYLNSPLVQFFDSISFSKRKHIFISKEISKNEVELRVKHISFYLFIRIEWVKNGTTVILICARVLT